MRFLLTAAVWCAVPVFAAELALHQCDEKFASCNDDCTLAHGSSTKDEARAKLGKCLSHCDNRDKSCRERYFDSQHSPKEAPKKVEAPAPPKKTAPAPAPASTPSAPAPEKKKDRSLDEWDAE
ncbi:MAG: hypothetical protein K1X64_12855 [Myxococcaceae bacterium]|nr:hypothetical protein [Myxococcaceae bacterium]